MNKNFLNHYLKKLHLVRKNISSFDEYPFSLFAIRNLKNLDFHQAVTFFVGENGTGKSTLLEAIAVALRFNPEGGTRNFNFSTRESHSVLHEYIRLSKGVNYFQNGYFLRAENFFNVATEIEELDKGPGGPPISDSYGKKSLHEQSHGESFFSLIMNRFGKNGFYILDEPEAALSPTRQMAFISRMHQLVRQDSQFIIATHSPIIMAYPNAKIYLLSEDGIATVKYKDTEHFSVMKEFMRNPEKMMEILLKE
ncbi:ABC transporter, ATP-binding protein [hydrothermal vent metagenome]|uniref:ABC transporter, ATP-binding protein n=1 Tax=hydrothermal vent metagenome TaxID=652676 RepID=A0A3B0VVI0_9ZZZZ